IHELHRLARLARENRRDDRVVVVARFAAEAAADRALDDAHVGLAHAQRRGDAVARVEQRLRVHIDRVLAGGGVVGDAADRFDRAVPLRRALKSILDDDVGLGECLLDVAALDVDDHGDVALLVVVDERRAGLHRLIGVEDARQLLPVDLDEIERLFGGVAVDRGDGGDFLADVAYLADGEGILIGEERAPRLFDRVFGGDNAADAAELLRLARVDAADARVREGTAQNLSVQHSRQDDVGDIARFAGRFLISFDALHASADDGKTLLGHVTFSRPVCRRRDSGSSLRARAFGQTGRL